MYLPEKGRIERLFVAHQAILCSPVCIRNIAKMGIFRIFRGKGRRDFSAVKTCWRRERDSNPQYRSEWRKSRRLRKLRGINWFKNSPADCLPPIRHAKRCGFAKLLEALAIVWLKVIYRRLPSGQMGSHVTACLPRS